MFVFFCVPAKLKAWEELQACWESQRNELEQRVEDEAEKVDKIEKYGTHHVYQKRVNLFKHMGLSH